MAGKTISIEDLKAAIAAYCNATNKTHSIGEDSKIRIMTSGGPQDGDAVVWLNAEGKIEDNKGGETVLDLMDYLKPSVVPVAGRSSGGNAIVPSPAGKPVKGQMVASNGILTPRDVIDYINPKATEHEAYLFAEFCRRKGADPMTKQVYLVIYEGQNGRNVSFIAGKEYFTEKAEAHPQFSGYEAGIIVKPSGGGDAERRIGTFWDSDEEKLVGGWAKVWRKDRDYPFVSEVPLKDYNTGKNQWTKMPATMIRKVPLVQSLREAFPGMFGGMYDRSEMNQAGIVDIDPEKEVSA